MRWIFTQLLRLVIIGGFLYTFVVLYPLTDNLPLLIFLGLFAVLPVVISADELKKGRKGFQRFVGSVFYALLRVVSAVLVQQYLTADWIVAVAAGIVIAYIIQMLRNWKSIQATTSLRQAELALRQNNGRQAVELAERAHDYSLENYDHLMRANSEMVLGMALAGSQQTQARQYLRSAQAIFTALGENARAAEAAGVVKKINQAGGLFGRRAQPELVDEGLPAVSLDEPIRGINWGFILNGELSVAMLILLLHLYSNHLLAASLAVHITAGVILLCLVYGLYALLVSRLAWLLKVVVSVLYILALGVAVVSALTYAYLVHWVVVADFPTWLQIPITNLFTRLAALNPLPQNEAFAAASGTALLVITLVLMVGRIGGHSSRREARGQSLSRAMELANMGSWGAASETLGQIDLLKVRDIPEREQLLFYKAFTEFQSNKFENARQHLQELLELNPDNPYGLYLLGYHDLKNGQLEEAGNYFDRLYRQQPDFAPDGGRPQQTIRYLYCLALYRLAMKLMAQQVDAGTELLGQVGRIGGLNKELADALIRVHLHRVTNLLRQRNRSAAQQELKLAEQQLAHLGSLIDDPKEVQKLKGLYQAAQGLLAIQAENFEDSARYLDESAQETKDIKQESSMFDRTSGSFFEQLLAAARQSREGTSDKLPPAFYADLHLLRAVSSLHRLQQSLQTSRKPDAKTHLKDIEGKLEQSLSVREDSLEARALLGLLYFYNSASKEEQEQGYEMLQTVKGRLKSRLISATIEKWEKEVQRQQDARKAYFDVLQQFMRSGDIPLDERLQLRDAVLHDMQMTGQYDEFVGYGNLEVDSARESEMTVDEYRQRAKLLKEKIEMLKQASRDSKVDPAIDELVKQLTDHNEALEKLIATIANTEKNLLARAGRIL